MAEKKKLDLSGSLPEMKVKSRSELWDADTEKSIFMTEYDNGDVEITCTRCFISDRLTVGNKHRERVLTSEQARRTYVCLNCWKKQQDEKGLFKFVDKADEIAWGQSFNLAVASLSEKQKENLDTAEALGVTGFEIVWKRQAIFYEKLSEYKRK